MKKNNNAVRGVAVMAIMSMALARAAVARDFDGIYTECGIGAMIAPGKPGLASFTNVTWDSGSTAITSNISSPDTCEGGKAKKVTFIHDTYPQLEKDLARGGGKHLTTLLSIAGCGTTVQGNVAQTLRKDFAEMVANPGYSAQSRYEHAKALYERFEQRLHSDFANFCSAG